MQERDRYREQSCIFNGWTVAEQYQRVWRFRNLKPYKTDSFISECGAVLNGDIKCWALWKIKFSNCWLAPNYYSYPTLNVHCVPCDVSQLIFLEQFSGFCYWPRAVQYQVQWLRNETPFSLTEPHYLISQACCSEVISCSVTTMSSLGTLNTRAFFLQPLSIQVVSEEIVIVRPRSNQHGAFLLAGLIFFSNISV